jgi:hypothetical protein
MLSTSVHFLAKDIIPSFLRAEQNSISLSIHPLMATFGSYSVLLFTLFDLTPVCLTCCISDLLFCFVFCFLFEYLLAFWLYRVPQDHLVYFLPPS